MGKAKRYYAVARGGRPGIYSEWFGPQGAEQQVRGVAGALYRGFSTLAEAQEWLDHPQSRGPEPRRGPAPEAPSAAGKVVVYTDGGCRGNPGPGGYGVVMMDGDQRREFARGYRMTTNNRMELMACIAALEALQEGADVLLYSDSRYVVMGVQKGWARKWRESRWMRTRTEPAQNSDLWEELLSLCDRRRVTMVWVRGHTGQEENERCDRLATLAAQGPNLQEDRGYVPKGQEEPGHPVAVTTG